LKTFLIRSASALVFGLIMIGSLLLSAWIFSAVMFVVTILALREFYSLEGWKALNPDKYTGLFCGILLYISVFIIFFFPKLFYISLILMAIAFIAVFITELFRLRENPFNRIALTLLGLIYVALPLALLNGFFFIHFNPIPVTTIVLLYFILIWTNDTMAYITGMLLGRHPLYKAVSPKKTIEGSLGGLVFTLAGAWIISRYNTDLSMLSWLGFALLVVVFGTLGDLIESMMKRSMKIKDSGNIMPGHGGLLDRFDAVLYSAPPIFVYLYIHYLLNL
jgi:phosphatidate cytidylyltransferase